MPDIRDKRDLRGLGGEVRQRRGPEAPERNYYEDIKLATTPEAYKKYLKGEESFQSAAATESSAISQAGKGVNRASSQLGTLEDATDRVWQKTKGTFTPIVFEGREKEYYVPEAIMKDLNLRGFQSELADIDGVKKYILRADADWLDSDNERDYMAPRDIESRKDLVESHLGEVEGILYNEWWKKNERPITEEYNKVAQQIADAGSQVGAARGALQAATGERSRQLTELQNQYQNRINRLEEIFGNV